VRSLDDIKVMINQDNDNLHTKPTKYRVTRTAATSGLGNDGLNEGEDDAILVPAGIPSTASDHVGTLPHLFTVAGLRSINEAAIQDEVSTQEIHSSGRKSPVKRNYSSPTKTSTSIGDRDRPVGEVVAGIPTAASEHFDSILKNTIYGSASEREMGRERAASSSASTSSQDMAAGKLSAVNTSLHITDNHRSSIALVNGLSVEEIEKSGREYTTVSRDSFKSIGTSSQSHLLAAGTPTKSSDHVDFSTFNDRVEGVSARAAGVAGGSRKMMSSTTYKEMFNTFEVLPVSDAERSIRYFIVFHRSVSMFIHSCPTIFYGCIQITQRH
jgi:hypothetical protein